MVGISDLLDSDIEESQDAIEDISNLSTSSTEPQGKTTQAKKGRKRRCVTMPKAKSRVTKASATEPKKPATKKVAAAKRKAAEEQVEQDGDEIQETQAPAPKRGRAAGKKATIPEPVKEEGDDLVEETVEIGPSPAFARSSHAPTRGRKVVPKPVARDSAQTKIRKTAQHAKKATLEPEPEDELLESDDDEMQIDQAPMARNASRNNSRQATTFRQRAGSASDTERGDPNLRRKLGDITRKYENIDLKYRSLKDVGVSEANANMEKLRKQCDATTQASNELIASLKKELSQQAPLVQDSRKLKKQVQTNEQELVDLRRANSTISASLTSAQNEIKNLQAKLAAARSSSASAEHPKVPGSAMKHHGQLRGAPSGPSETTQSAQMKEELYRDLTGLIIRGVKRTEEGDTYDCIQTGRNGTLHFKLYVDAEEAKTASFQETEFLYTPLLDANRDGDMMELMPNYLTEEITFAREDASKFYCRVLDTLTKRRVEEHE
ncbi:uncharacterized protein HMPREF1541_01263 [Cyphellophora europaea CBS 101466]|uniref:Monopolin complex subunit Csm1/Pcs1 C-terminal domain-containing protein n=1 Tax=Cyphellophora europaea (strain CBS 101466) TaxID=1220924 RepID=W2SGE3_CYPE1|nr:uncharacterized protein HMPREF1541_01263 [Cyphellophora europaea CBS 101466]ETN47073.1 hypothetical protein HMPREF1541_01263 [Cyphellophora europaea CBS 101466]